MANAPSGPAAQWVLLKGSTRQLLPNSVPVGAADLNQIIALTVKVRSRGNLAELAEEIKKISAQPLKERTYMSREDLARTYGANADDLDKVELYANKHHLRVAERDEGTRRVVLKGTLRDALSAFRADVQMYQHASGVYRGRRGEILLPAELKDLVTGIFGFDTRPKHRAPRRSMPTSSAAATSLGEFASVFADRYKFPTTSGSTKLDGAGQCIALIELGGGYSHNDLKIFFSDAGVPMPEVVAVSVDHGVNHPTPHGQADGEVMLDIEVAGVAAPGAKLAVYFAPNSDSGFQDAIRAAVHDNARTPSVVSISWGEPDDFLTQQSIEAYSEIFAAAAVLGVTVCAASGDHGVADLDAAHWDKGIHVNHPASDPMVLCCGGTQIDSNVDVVWNDGTRFDVQVFGGGGWAGGGGISTVFGVPDYQTGLKILGKPIAGRGCPDIAMTADNYRTRVQGLDAPSGGTSAVTPLAACLIAKLNQAYGKNLGFVNPKLYQNPQAFTDVKVGTNGIKQTIEGYPATVGWDACTGLGTPIGSTLLQVLQE
ncbi:S53 family peptidase [Cupriavidus sp. WKF15]|uniref:S53 family peptidase n=1 Tax=Cupriavidus sp. WKF15 TaxID=3032282 RepID=UPI0023E1DD7A|nr:S53 family peptidase [Cupriavidus sp. WKF15]WER50527.1 S53 family peptidase [Cupriavidus sp. WKF15]